MEKLKSGTGLLLAAAVALAVAAVPSAAHAKKDPHGYAANQAAVSMFLQQQAQASGQAYNPYANGAALGYGAYNPNLYNSSLYGPYSNPNAYNAYNPYNQYNQYNQYNPYLGNNLLGVNGNLNAYNAYGYNPYLNNSTFVDPYYGYNQQFGNPRISNLSNLLRNLF